MQAAMSATSLFITQMVIYSLCPLFCISSCLYKSLSAVGDSLWTHTGPWPHFPWPRGSPPMDGPPVTTSGLSGPQVHVGCPQSRCYERRCSSRPSSQVCACACVAVGAVPTTTQVELLFQRVCAPYILLDIFRLPPFAFWKCVFLKVPCPHPRFRLISLVKNHCSPPAQRGES